MGILEILALAAKLGVQVADLIGLAHKIQTEDRDPTPEEVAQVEKMKAEAEAAWKAAIS